MSELLFERYVDPVYLIVTNDDVCECVHGVVTNEAEYLRILVQIKEQKLEGYFLKDIESGHRYSITSGGRTHVKGFNPYPEIDRLMKALMGF